MKRRILATTIAIFLTARAFAVTDTWDGGGANDNLSTALNWLDNSAPASDLINTDLIFAGGVRLTPNVSAVFSTDSVTFDNTAGAFTIGGTTLTIGTGGIVNNDLQVQTFGNVVAVGTAASTFNAAGAGLTFTNGVNIGANTLTLAGAGAYSFANFSGTGTLNKTGTGTMTWAPTGTNQFDLTIGAGTVTTTADGSTDVFNATGNIAVNGTSALILGESLTLDGATLTRASGANFTLAAGETLTAQNGGTATFTTSENFIGANLTVTGAGSAITSTSNININSGSTVQVSAGGDLVATNLLNIGNAGPGLHTVTVDGAGSQLSGSGGGTWGSSTGVTNATFSNGAAGSFGGTLNLGSSSSPGSSGTVLVQSGADVTTAALQVAATATAGISGSITVTGTGSTWTISGGSIMTVGAASGSTASVNINSGGAFNSSTGNHGYLATATLAIAGGTYNSNGNLSILGGQFTRDAAGALNLTAGHTFNVLSGGDAIFTGGYNNSTASFIDVSGAGSTFSTTGTLAFQGGSIVNVTAGGSISTGGAPVQIGISGNGTVTVDGSGSSFAGGDLTLGQSAIGSLTFSNASTGGFGAIVIDNAFLVGGGGTLSVQSGATVTATGLTISPGASGNTGLLTITGVGSALTLTGPATAAIGTTDTNTATLDVLNGGTFTSGTGAVTLNATGVINIDGGTVNLLGPLVRNGGSVNFTAGSLSIVSNWSVGAGGLLGTNVTFDATRQFTTTGTTTVDAFRTLTISGGTLSTGVLTNNGTIAFNSGKLAVTGAGGFTIGSGALGANVSLGTGANLQVTNTATVASGATLTLSGGSFTAGMLNVTGTLRANLGTASATGGTNNSGGRIFVGDSLAISGAFTNASGGRITLENGSGLLSGAGTLNNSGLVTGDGTIAKPLTNGSTGEVRGESGRTLAITGAAINSGQFNLVGGTLDFTSAVTNNAAGFISGHGALFTGGLTNSGQMAFAGGNTDIRGDVTLTAGARVVTSGASSATTFYDDVVHNGLEIFTGASASTIFFGDQSGAGPFTGTGTVYYIGDLRPGNSPANVPYAGDLVFSSAATLALEIGGTTPGSEYDRLTIAGGASLDGTLDVSLISGFTPVAGQQFTILTAGSIVNNGFVLGGPAASSFSLLVNSTSVILQAIGLAGDFNHDGAVDAADYVVWRKDPTSNGGTPGGYNTWRANFGDPAPGSGSGPLANGVPEPSTAMLLILAAVSLRLGRRRSAQRVPKLINA